MFGSECFSLESGAKPGVVCNGNSCLLPFVRSPYVMRLPPGNYFIETWGASGGTQKVNLATPRYGEGGLGGYSRGILSLSKTEKLYGYVGGEGPSYTDPSPRIANGGWNGGGASLNRESSQGGGTGGGGSTDICTILSPMANQNSQTIRTIESYKSRIIVAGGGGGGFGMTNYNYDNHRITSNGGYGGGTESGGSGYLISTQCSVSNCGIDIYLSDSSPFVFNYVTFSNQESTGEAKNRNNQQNNWLSQSSGGIFGYGGNSLSSNYNSGGGGGAGWFGGRGGAAGFNYYGTGGAGGSGYVHLGTNEYSSLNNKYILKNAETFQGIENFPTPHSFFINETGHKGNGFIRISFVSSSTLGMVKVTVSKLLLWSLSIVQIDIGGICQSLQHNNLS